ncbi:MAG: permease-like cell division protein FtsX [Steroidobacteraceae bacterium]
MTGPGTWLARHLQAALGAAGRLARAPLATLFTIAVIGLALALPLGLKLFVDNARAATGDFANAVDLSVYFRLGTPIEKVRQLAQRAQSRPGVAAVKVIPADAALAEFRKYSGFGVALDAVTDNPLPHVLGIRPRAGADSTAEIAKLKDYFASWPEVELVQMDIEWVHRFNAILEVLRRALGVAAVVLAFGVLAVVGNTIRLEIQNRRAEIEVTKLVGGSNAFVRRPFLYTGTLYGVLGAVLALAIVFSATALLAPAVADLAAAYGSRYTLLGPGQDDTLRLLGGGALLGWIGAWGAAARHLRAIEPQA